MKRVVSMSALAAMVGMACSSGPSIEVDYDPANAGKIATYKTFSWMPAPADYEAPVSSIVLSRIGDAVENTMANKGITVKESGPTDFKMGWHLTTEAMTDYRTVNNSYGYGGYGWYGRGGGMGMATTTSTTTQQNWTQGTFILDVVDSETNNLVWRGVASGEIKSDYSPQESAERVQELTDKMFANFPPQAN